MTKPPPKKQHQEDYIKTALRLPPDLHARLKSDAEIAGRSLNAEIVMSLQRAKTDTLEGELNDIKLTLRKILDAVT
jgi:predicted HicB family RNase H-like nuclease